MFGTKGKRKEEEKCAKQGTKRGRKQKLTPYQKVKPNYVWLTSLKK